MELWNTKCIWSIWMNLVQLEVLAVFGFYLDDLLE